MSFGSRVGRLTAGAAASLLVAVGAPAVAAASGEVTDGTLDWGVKESFRAYVVSPVAGGAIEVSDGASQNADGTFRFTGGAGSMADGAADLTFSGSVRFTGHDGALEVIVSNPEVHIDGDSGTLVADVSGLSQDGALVEFADIVLANLDASGVSLDAASGIAATLSEAGAPAFGGFYQAGEALDPVSFSVPASGDAGADDAADDAATDDTAADDTAADDTAADDAAGTGDALPKTGVPWFVLAVGGLVLVAIGAAFVVLGRQVGPASE